MLTLIKNTNSWKICTLIFFASLANRVTTKSPKNMTNHIAKPQYNFWGPTWNYYSKYAGFLFCFADYSLLIYFKFYANFIVKEGNYYANSKKFVLPSSLFMLELRAGCHSQLKWCLRSYGKYFSLRWPPALIIHKFICEKITLQNC